MSSLPTWQGTSKQPPTFRSPMFLGPESSP
jgi:hypothetical protein